MYCLLNNPPLFLMFYLKIFKCASVLNAVEVLVFEITGQTQKHEEGGEKRIFSL